MLNLTKEIFDIPHVAGYKIDKLEKGLVTGGIEYYLTIRFDDSLLITYRLDPDHIITEDESYIRQLVYEIKTECKILRNKAMN